MMPSDAPVGDEINGPGRRYYDDVVLDNLMESLLELTAAVWTYHDRSLVLERVLERLLASSHDRPDLAREIEAYRPSPEDLARRRAEREQLVSDVFRSFARRPSLESAQLGAGRLGDTDTRPGDSP